MTVILTAILAAYSAPRNALTDPSDVHVHATGLVTVGGDATPTTFLADSKADSGDSDTTEEDKGGCSTSGGSASGLAGLLALGLLAGRRRK